MRPYDRNDFVDELLCHVLDHYPGPESGYSTTFLMGTRISVCGGCTWMRMRSVRLQPMRAICREVLSEIRLAVMFCSPCSRKIGTGSFSP